MSGDRRPGDGADGPEDLGAESKRPGAREDDAAGGIGGESRSLDRLRGDIDGIDQQLVDLLSERLRLAQEIGKAKAESGRSFFDPARERRVFEKVRGLAGHRYPPESLESIYREIISASRTAQAGETVLVHGSPGSLAHEAAHARFGTGPRFEWTPSDREVFGRLGDGSCHYAVVSLEGRSLEVSIDRLDLFLHSSAQVFAEVAVRPRLSVLVPPGSSLAQAGSRGSADGELPANVPLFGTAGILAAASTFLSERTEAPVEVMATLADALRAAESRGGAILAPPVVAAVHGWREIAIAVQDEAGARRRFFVLAPGSAPPCGRDRTLLLLVLANRSGALHGVTEVLVECGLNLSWLEPKSSHLGSWDHLFLFEVDGHREDANVARAVERLAGRTEVLRVLGSYPREFT